MEVGHEERSQADSGDVRGLGVLAFSERSGVGWKRLRIGHEQIW